MSEMMSEGQPAKLPSFGGYSLETLPYLTLPFTLIYL